MSSAVPTESHAWLERFMAQSGIGGYAAGHFKDWELCVVLCRTTQPLFRQMIVYAASPAPKYSLIHVFVDDRRP